MALGTYLATMEVPVRITYDPDAAEQYDLMRAYLPFGLALWILSLVFLVRGILSGVGKRLAVAELRKPFSMVTVVVGVATGVLALVSTFLPWVIAERVEPLMETRGGSFDVGQYHALTGVGLMMGTNSMAGDVILLVFVGAITGTLHIPLLTLLKSERTNVMTAFLFLLGGMCIIGPLASVYAHRTWWISLRVNGALGFAATFESPGMGFLIATSCAIGLVGSGVVTAVKLAR